MAVSKSVVESLNKQLVQAELDRDIAQRRVISLESSKLRPRQAAEVQQDLVMTTELYRRGEWEVLRSLLQRLILRVDVLLWRHPGEHPRVKRGEVVIHWRDLDFVKQLGNVMDTSLQQCVLYVLEAGYRHSAA